MRDDRRSTKRKRAGPSTTMPVAYVSPTIKGASGYVDVATAAYAFDTTGSVTLLNTVPQGSSQMQRVGKKILLKSLQCRGFVANNSTATYNDCAMLIVYDKRPRGALPAITDILASASSNAMNNDDNSGRFQIIRRFDFALIGNATNITEASYKSSDFYQKLKHRTVYTSLGTGLIADIEEGALYLVTIGNVAAGTAAASSNLGFRLRYYDINQ